MEKIRLMTCCFIPSLLTMLVLSKWHVWHFLTLNNTSLSPNASPCPSHFDIWPAALTHSNCRCHVCTFRECPSSCPSCEVLKEGHLRDCGGGSDGFSTEKILDKACQTDVWESERQQLMSNALMEVCYIEFTFSSSISHLFHFSALVHQCPSFALFLFNAQNQTWLA